ncbi:MAG TPA: PQQ-binding-like beta-propeller repeat protein [Planctomycetaceae bacterium]|nr:PQQ-binding-like beta-propeller repeat protein [Planctomycetaceae bacterium]
MKFVCWLSLLTCVVIGSVWTASARAEKPSATSVGFAFSADDWPGWRGPSGTGVANPQQSPPLVWSESQNVLWKAPVPGRGHGSPTVVGDHVYLAAAETDTEVQSVICFDRQTGKTLWQTPIHRGHFDKKGNAKSSHASSSVACDGDRLFINFLNHDAVWTTALSRDGKILWQTKIADFVNHQGFGSSPIVYGPLVLVSADSKGGAGRVAGLDRSTGDTVWSIERPKLPNYASPIVVNAAGRDQIVMIGCDLVMGLDPLTGKTLWQTAGSTEECVTSTVTDGQLIYTSGGYPRNHVSAIAADGSGKVAWQNGVRVYVPSMVIKDGYLYAVLDAGVAMCWKADSGEEQWKGRLGGTFSASLVLVGDTLFAIDESGRTCVWKANPQQFELLAENRLGSEAFATPAICGSRLYFRVASQVDGKRQEMLYCIGDGK